MKKLYLSIIAGIFLLSLDVASAKNVSPESGEMPASHTSKKSSKIKKLHKKLAETKNRIKLNFGKIHKQDEKK